MDAFRYGMYARKYNAVPGAMDLSGRNFHTFFTWPSLSPVALDARSTAPDRTDIFHRGHFRGYPRGSVSPESKRLWARHAMQDIGKEDGTRPLFEPSLAWHTVGNAILEQCGNTRGKRKVFPQNVSTFFPMRLIFRTLPPPHRMSV